MITVNTQAIVLRSVKYKDNDLILTLFTRKLGKISVIARGAKRPKSKLLSAVQVFSYCNFSLMKTGNMYKILQAESIKNFYRISQDLESFSYGAFLLSLTEKSIYENQTNNRLFNALVNTIYILAEDDGKVNKKFLITAFELQFLNYIGFKPEVNKCSNCGNSESPFKFNIQSGGLVCSECLDRVFGKNISIDPTTIVLMQSILKNDIIKCSEFKVSKVLVIELYNIMKQYLIEYVDNIDFKALDLIL